MLTALSRSPEETLALGLQWGEQARAGWVIGLSGELGAGKTQLVKGLALGLGIAGRVHSPTFTIVHEYEGGRLLLAHLDLYRLETPSALGSAGLEDYLYAPPGVVVIEWFDRWETAGMRPPAGLLRRVRIETGGPDERRIHYEDSGA
jgi:tRNA threonylcarbamoyladenosine biosynthesis protein TsaE